MPGVIIELKVAKNCSDDELKKLSEVALKQINNRKYKTELTTKGVKNVFKYGVVLSGKKVRISDPSING